VRPIPLRHLLAAFSPSAPFFPGTASACAPCRGLTSERIYGKLNTVKRELQNFSVFAFFACLKGLVRRVTPFRRPRVGIAQSLPARRTSPSSPRRKGSSRSAEPLRRVTGGFFFFPPLPEKLSVAFRRGRAFLPPSFCLIDLSSDIPSRDSFSPLSSLSSPLVALLAFKSPPFLCKEAGLL